MLSALFSSAQVPGYLGKKILIGGGILFGSPNYEDHYPQTYKPIINPSISLNKYYRVYADIVFTQRKSVCFAFKNASMGYVNSLYYTAAHNYNLTNGYDYVVTKLAISSFDMGIKYHLSGNISPLGSYIMYGLAFHSINETDPENNYAKAALPFLASKTNFTGVFLGLGTNYVVKDLLVLSVSMETEFSFAGDNDLHKKYIIQRWRHSTYFNLGFGIGVLL